MIWKMPNLFHTHSVSRLPCSRGRAGLSLRELQRRSQPLGRTEKVGHSALIETKDLFTVILAQQGGVTYSQRTHPALSHTMTWNRLYQFGHTAVTSRHPSISKQLFHCKASMHH